MTTIRGTLCCERVKDPAYARCACGWSVAVRSQREAKRRFHHHLRLVKAAGYRGNTQDAA